jgi:hypothetical protein
MVKNSPNSSSASHPAIFFFPNSREISSGSANKHFARNYPDLELCREKEVGRKSGINTRQ